MRNQENQVPEVCSKCQRSGDFDVSKGGCRHSPIYNASGWDGYEQYLKDMEAEKEANAEAKKEASIGANEADDMATNNLTGSGSPGNLESVGLLSPHGPMVPPNIRDAELTTPRLRNQTIIQGLRLVLVCLNRQRLRSGRVQQPKIHIGMRFQQLSANFSVVTIWMAVARYGCLLFFCLWNEVCVLQLNSRQEVSMLAFNVSYRLKSGMDPDHIEEPHVPHTASNSSAMLCIKGLY